MVSDLTVNKRFAKIIRNIHMFFRNLIRIIRKKSMNCSWNSNKATDVGILLNNFFKILQ